MIDVVAAGVIDGKIVADSKGPRSASCCRTGSRLADCGNHHPRGSRVDDDEENLHNRRIQRTYTADRVSRRIACLRLLLPPPSRP